MKKFIITFGAIFFFTTSIFASNGTEKLMTKKIETKLQKKEQTTYAWEVETIYGKATGSSVSLDKATKMIDLLGKKDITTYKIIISY